MRRSLSGLYQEMLLQCIPKLWKLRILVIKFWQCFYRLKCIFWSFVYFFTNFRSFFFCLTIRVIPLVSKTMWYEQSNQSTCNQIVITWSLTSGFQVCWKGQCLESALTFCVQIDHVTPHSNWLDFVYFSRVVFLPMVSEWRGVFCTDEILFLNSTKIITF